MCVFSVCPWQNHPLNVAFVPIALKWHITFYLLNLGVNSQARIGLAPQNTVHVIGQATPLYFNCSIENLLAHDSFTWNKYKTLNNIDFATITAQQLNQPHTVIFPNEYDVEGTNLIVKDADFDDAGRYLCRNALSPFTAHITVEAIILGKCAWLLLHQFT